MTLLVFNKVLYLRIVSSVSKQHPNYYFKSLKFHLSHLLKCKVKNIIYRLTNPNTDIVCIS